MRVRVLSIAALAALVWVATVLLSASVPQLEEWSAPSAIAAGPSIYWGALVKGQAPSDSNMAAGGVFDQFEKRAGKKMSIIHWGQPWKMSGQFQPFQTKYFDNVRNHGSIPMLHWGSWALGYGENQSDFQLRDIYNGTYDWYIRQWAIDAKNWGHPFFLRFDWEMNGWWQFPWAEQINGNQPGDYVKAWRHVHDIFTSVGANNVNWVWCPNVVSDKATPLWEVYPGDSYVDWVAVDGYNWGTDKSGGWGWQTFDQIFHQTYDQLGQLAPSKPVMIGETASSEDGGPVGRPASKAAWIKDVLETELPYWYTRVKAFLWFNWNDGNPALDWPVETSQQSIDTFAAGIKSAFYVPNDFNQLQTPKIPANPPCMTWQSSPDNGQHLSSGSVLLKWIWVSCADSYRVIIKQDSTRSPSQVWNVTVSGTQYWTPPLTPGHTYYWRIRACNSYGCGMTPLRRFYVP